MFKNRNKASTSVFASEKPIPSFALESLEGRRLLSHGMGGHLINTVQFSQAPSAVQAGLNTLATADNVTAPTSTQNVLLGNTNGVETYSVVISGTGTTTKLTVDQNGNPVTAPTKSTTTFGAVSNTAVTNEFNAIATALGLTAPASTDNVSVNTPSGGTAVYTMRLINSSTANPWHRGTVISVDANGNPTGNERIPFSAIPSAIQNGLNANAPSGATAISSTSTQLVSVQTLNGLTYYSVKFTATGTITVVTVDSTGKLATLPSTSAGQFSTIPSPAQTELQTLATADGVSGTIATTQNVKIYDEGNGTTLYSVTLAAANSSGTGTHNITLTVDANGNPTVPPGGGCLFGGSFGGGGFFGFGGAGFSFRRF